ncbi:helix-turn-helix transcriptional regulator [Pseudofulvibacter geojedonensis]|uniref:HTH luxR-type domain-containing protein n=1 Tax=Pseudofulvibacter geojedonensis TaxID=1123758 RepID=A0ABW3HZ93_9FLAO
MFDKIISFHTAIINKGIEYVSSEFDKRALRLLNMICLYGASLILPLIFIRKIIEADYFSIILLFIAETILVCVVYLNSIGKSQISCLIYVFTINTLGYVAVYLENQQSEIPFVAFALGSFSLFLIKDKVLRNISFLYSFTTFSILYYFQLTEKVFGISGYVLTLMVLLIFSFGLRFVNSMRNRDEKTILEQNEKLKDQNEMIKVKSEQLLQSEKLRHQQELELKEKDIEMILTNAKIQDRLNENIIAKLKQAKEKGVLEQNINQVILELKNQNEINNRIQILQQNIGVVNASFFGKLDKAHPNMTRVDKEFCSYIKIGMSSKEIAIIRNTSVNSVVVTKSRLRKKLNLLSNKDIAPYLASL